MATKDLLQSFIRALGDPTRGAILTELAHEGELTATQLARRLGLTANNVYHHMRVLRDLGMVGAPRAAPRETYVEKYYQLAPEMQTLLNGGRDPEWFDRAQNDLTTEERKELFIVMCLTMAQLLQRAARRYATMNTQEFDELIRQRQLGLLSINDMGQERLESRLTSLKELLRQEYETDFAEEGAAYQRPQHVVLMAALPLLWAVENEDSDA